MKSSDIPVTSRQQHLLALIWLIALPGCTSASRHKLWQTLDPAGYKHTHSEVFNPKKYRRDIPPDSPPVIDGMELEITR